MTPQQPDETSVSTSAPDDSQPPERHERRSGAGRRRRPKPRRQTSFWREVPVLVVIALALALLIKTFLVQAFYIPSDSMMNTLQRQDRVLVNKVVYQLRDIRRGEVVVFRGEDSWAPEAVPPEASNPAERALRWLSSTLGLSQSGERDFIKRVVGVGGDRVACCDDQGRVTVNGRSLTEPYIFENSPLRNAGCTSREFGPVTVPDGRLWVMGDHRSMSSDSRCHVEDRHGGTVAQSAVVGRAFVVVWPFDRLQRLQAEGGFVEASARAVAGSLPYVAAGVLVLPVGALRRRRRRA